MIIWIFLTATKGIKELEMHEFILTLGAAPVQRGRPQGPGNLKDLKGLGKGTGLPRAHNQPEGSFIPSAACARTRPLESGPLHRRNHPPAVEGLFMKGWCVMGNDAPEEERLLSTRDIAAMFSVHKHTAGGWVKKGLLTGIKTPGGQWRCKESEVRELLKFPPP
jgi:excisionase family DNA binding protein